MRGNLDPLRELPPAYPPERAPCTYDQALLRKVLFLQPHMREAAMDSCGVAFNAGALGALCWFLATEEGDEVSLEAFKCTAVVLQMVSVFAEEILANFQFFQAFLLLGLLTFMVNRWQEFLVTSHTVQARLHDIGVCMGMAVIKPENQETCILLSWKVSTQHTLSVPGRRTVWHLRSEVRQLSFALQLPHALIGQPPAQPHNLTIPAYLCTLIGAGCSSSSTDVCHTGLEPRTFRSATHTRLSLALDRPERGAWTNLPERAPSDAADAKRLRVPGLAHYD